ncbi:TPA: hypothetical protein I8Y21_003861 [Klebsiella oxytoca]|uniref:Uncharacterized protein n=1 Tax=Klebsiella oxytoca TaxID=571 RepID=A0AAN5LBQ2_KLEOX|nr:hypothetical protein [Klebsiella oxytoca]
MSRLLLNIVTYNRDLVPLGGINCAIYLSTLLRHYRDWSINDGWMLLNIDPIQCVTGLKPEEQRAARITLRDMGIIRDGMAFDEPAMCIDLNKVNEFLDGVATDDY